MNGFDSYSLHRFLNPLFTKIGSVYTLRIEGVRIVGHGHHNRPGPGQFLYERIWRRLGQLSTRIAFLILYGSDPFVLLPMRVDSIRPWFISPRFRKADLSMNRIKQRDQEISNLSNLLIIFLQIR